MDKDLRKALDSANGELTWLVVAIIIAVLAVVAIIVGLQALLFMWAWNLIVAGFFHWAPALHSTQSLAMIVLFDLIVNGLHFLTGGFFRKVS